MSNWKYFHFRNSIATLDSWWPHMRNSRFTQWFNTNVITRLSRRDLSLISGRVIIISMIGGRSGARCVLNMRSSSLMIGGSYTHVQGSIVILCGRLRDKYSILMTLVYFLEVITA